VRFRALVLVFLGLAMSFSVFGQSRTIEDTLVVTDPTVASAGNWKIGGSIEYWQTQNKWDIYQPIVGTAELDFKQTGYNLFVAYGNWTLQGTARKGSGDYSASGTATCCGNVTFGGPQDVKDSEFTLRYLWPSQKVSPYILLGYSTTKVESTEDIRTAQIPAVWTCTNTTHRTTSTEYKGPLLGAGFILPFNQSLGMRTDIRLKYQNGKYDEHGTQAACLHNTGSGLGYDFTLTGYWNIIGGLNAQLGAKSQWLNAGDDVPGWYKFGVFAMLGYSYRF